MATPQEYAAATAAALKIAQADIDQEVPVVFRGDVPVGAVEKFAADAAKSAVDAVDLMRAKTNPAITAPPMQGA